MLFRGEAKGTEFPCESDRKRIKTIQDNRRLWQSDHETVFTRIATDLPYEEQQALRKHWAGLQYVCCNLLGLLSRDTAEHLSLDASEITSEQEAAQVVVDDVRRRSAWDSVLMDMVEECSALGGIGLKVYRDEGVAPVIDTVSPDACFRGEDYFAEYAKANADPRKTIAPFCASIHRRGGAWYVLIEIHEAGAVIYRAYEWSVEPTQKGQPTFADKGMLGKEIDPLELMPMLEGTSGDRIVETGIDEPTLLLLQNELDAMDRRWGRSDYSRDLRDLQGQFEDKLSVLLRHFHELVNGGTTVLPVEAQAMVQRRGQFGPGKKATDFGRAQVGSDTMPTIDAGEMNVIFEDAQSRDTTRHVSRTPQYDGGLQSLQLIMSAFERCGNITLDKLLGDTAAPESGRAMRLARYRDIKRVKRKGMRLSRHLAKAYEIALALVQVPDMVSYAFPEPFPAGMEERMEGVERAVQAPFMTIETALASLLGWTTEEAENEAAKLQAERHATGMQTQLRGAFGQAPTTPAAFDEPAEDEEPEA